MIFNQLYPQFESVNNRHRTVNNPEDWIGSGTDALKGFSWRSGSTRDTTGITFWSDVFLYDPPHGNPMAILLVDTQGLFDPESSTDENSKILALTTLFSSTVFLNVNGVLQEDTLQYLQYTTEFAVFSKSSSSVQVSKPFQKLLFLVRDWQNVDDYDFGFDGGSKYLSEFLKSKPNQPEALKSVREHLRDSFDELPCFLMPYPGKKVAVSSDYDGRWSLMDEDFLAELKSLISQILKPQSIVVKKVDGVDLKAAELNSMIQGKVVVMPVIVRLKLTSL
jgi:atlastin